MRVVSRAQYLTSVAGTMRKSDYDAIHLVKAVKGKELSAGAYSFVTIGSKRVKITDENRDAAIDWFAEWAAARVQELALGNQKVVLVPIPGGDVTAGSPPDFRTAVLANAIASRLILATASPALRWRKPRPKSTDANSRKPELLYPELAWISNLPAKRVILIDDVYTTGGHLVAAAWKVTELRHLVIGAVCCGRTCHDQLQNPFEVAPEELPVPSPPKPIGT